MHSVSESPVLAGGEEVLAAVAARPGGPELLRLAREREDVALVGGAVRDLMLGRSPRELDAVVAAETPVLARELAQLLGASATVHERFGTAVIEWRQGRIDLAERRAESYPSPGALPQVRSGGAEEDLARRDFTVNAISVALGGSERGRLRAAEHALEDLAARRLRVLHEQSFRDDPTRLLRLCRYRARLGFDVEPHTAELANRALASGALDTVSRARLGAELRLALREEDALAALGELDELGVLRALDPSLRLDAELVRRALALLPDDGRPDLLQIASLLLELAASDREDPEGSMYELLDGLEFTAAERERIMRSALDAPALVARMADATKPSQLHDALFAHTLEAVALAGALSERGRASVTAQATDWLARLRHVRLAINGDDLLEAGIAAGPQLGMRLDAALACKLDGELEDGRDAELRAAMEATVCLRGGCES